MKFRANFQRTILFFIVILVTMYFIFFLSCKCKELLSKNFEVETRLNVQITIALTALSFCITIITELSKDIKKKKSLSSTEYTNGVKSLKKIKNNSEIACAKISCITSDESTIRTTRTKRILKVKRITIKRETKILEIAVNNIGNNSETFDILNELSDKPPK